MKNPLLLIFSIVFVLLPLHAADEEYHIMHGASFTFRNNVPYIRVLVNSFKNSINLKGDLTIECNGNLISGKDFSVTSLQKKKRKLLYRVSIEEVSKNRLKNIAAIKKRWEKKTGESLGIFVFGGVFSINNRKIDNREYYIALDRNLPFKKAAYYSGTFRKKYPDKSIRILPVLMQPASYTLTVKENDNTIGTCDNKIGIRYSGNVKVNDTTYENIGSLMFTGAKGNRISMVTEENIEDILYRILPGEMFLSAPIETLKAQAVAARTDIFMQLGKRHVDEPLHICSEVHCQKIEWDKDIYPKFKKAVDETKGEVILYKELYIARAPYSSSAGGHTENIRFVWFTADKPYLRGVWDSEKELKLDLRKESDLKQFLQMDYGEDNIKTNSRHRWTKTITQQKIDNLLKNLRIGKLKRIEALKRGVSGRIYVARFIGDKGYKTIYGELVIRRLLDNMNSSMFLVEKVDDSWVFTGGGWGHGVGMSQMGAIGLGRKNKSYDFILKRYYPGISVVKLYGQHNPVQDANNQDDKKKQ